RRAKDDGSSPLGEFLLLQVERSGFAPATTRTSFPGWDALRVLGGEIAELSAFATGEEAATGEPVMLSGSFERGGLYQVSLLPYDGQGTSRFVVVGRAGRAELVFPLGPDGPSFLDWQDASGQQHEESWNEEDPWPPLIEAFEAAVAGRASAVSWQDEVRA